MIIVKSILLVFAALAYLALCHYYIIPAVKFMEYAPFLLIKL